VPFTFSCYVIRHGEDVMVWDTGYQPGSNPSAPKVSLVEQLAQLKIRPEQVKFVGISHFHPDHTGQLGALTSATLLIGEREWAALTAPKPMAGANVPALHAVDQRRQQGRAAGLPTRTSSATAVS
jgi:glyoxylase-like metal-dependent hydrolase (beta-lactamase superfamily II)